MQKHTPEPWRMNPSDWTTIIDASNDTSDARDICHVNDEKEDWGLGGNPSANAARIVACVNACAGINPEAVPGMLATLRCIAGVWDNYFGGECLGELNRADTEKFMLDAFKECVEDARAALAKAHAK